MTVIRRAAGALLLAALAGPLAAGPLRGLILTSPGVYHDYAYQTRALAAGIAARVNIAFDISLAELERWKHTDFARDYDVLVYDICMADNRDGELIANMRRQSAVLGVPAIVLHCSMHSFRETDLWWPLYGLQTKAHEALRPLPQAHARAHPVLTGVPRDWVVANDELYLNLAFDAQPLLLSTGEDGREHVTTWLAMAGSTPLFGTTLGHSDETVDDPVYQRLLANAVLLLTGNLADDGGARAGLEPDPARAAVHTLSKPAGVDFLDTASRRCVQRGMAMAVGPCYVGCVLHPLKWGAEADACKRSCEAGLPSSDELIADCRD